MGKLKLLYHGSSLRAGVLEPVLEHRTTEHVHTKAAVFATERKDLAALFMFPIDRLASVGFEEGIAYICIWGTPEDLQGHVPKGFLYTLPSGSFQKIGKEYEWQSFEAVIPLEVEEYESAIDGLIENDVQVYFINDEKLFDRITAETARAQILKNLTSENQRRSQQAW